MRFTLLLKANRMYAAYKFFNNNLKEKSRKEFFQLSYKDRIEMVAFVHDQFMRKGEAGSAFILMQDYKPELIKPEYDEYRGGSYQDLKNNDV